MEDSPRAAPVLTGRQRRHLRGLAQRIEPSVWVGDSGLTEGVVRAIEEALRAHELVKVRMRQPPDKKAMAAALAESCGAVLCGLVGHTAILYRPDAEAPRIELPT